MNEILLPPYVVNEFGPVLPQSQTIDWGAQKLRIPGIHREYGLTGKGIRIAVIDTGIDPNHPDLAGAVYKTVNVTSEAFSASNGHGIGAAGIIAARNNATGVLGVAPDSKILGIKGMRESGAGSFNELIRGIDAAIKERVHIINLSLGAATNVASFQSAINRAVGSGIIVVCAAGNNGRDNSVTFPAKYPNTIAVGATNSVDKVSAFSSRGWEVDIAAPGERVLTTWRNKSYAKVSGTSFACPYVAGVIALLLEAKITVTNSRLKQTARDIEEPGEDVKSGHGIINPHEMIRRFMTTQPTPTPTPVPSTPPAPVPTPGTPAPAPEHDYTKVRQALTLLNQYLQGK